MRIENITAKRLKDLLDEDLNHLRSRFINIFNRYFEGSDVQKAVNIDRRIFLIKYMTLRSEMGSRKMKFFHETPIDREVYNRIFKRSIWELDVPVLGDMVIVPEYISVGGSFVKSPKEAEDIDIIIRDSEKNRDESFELKVGRLIRGQTKKEPHFVYAPRGPHSSYIPVFDLTLRARDDTKKIGVKESIVAKELTPAQRKECDKESERIKDNRKKATFPHKFRPAKYTHPNGHPRCLICSDEESIGGICRKADIEKESREYFEGLDNWDKDLKSDNAEVIKNLAEGSMLDLGCGTCKLLTILSGTGRETAGVDRSDIALGFCKKREIETKKVDLEKDELPFKDSSFDNVISVHTLEHLEFPEKLIKDACRIAKKRVIILSPLGERMDPTHKQEFKELKDFKKFFNDSWDIKEIEESNSAIAVLNISEFKKAALAPFGRFTPPKPTMAGFTEAFSVEEIWSWAKDKFPLDVEEKLNGFRFIIEKAGDRVRLKTEGDKDRTKQLAPLAEALKKIPDDFIIDCSMGIERDGKALPRIRLMTLMADEPKLEERDVIKATMFDLPYWKEDLHEKPLSERRKSLEVLYNKYLKGNPHFGLTNFIVVKDRKGLEQQFRKLAQLPQSEGILIKTLDGKWDTDGSCETWAKIKREAEIKVIVLARHDVKGGNYNYTCGLLPGDSGFGNLTEFRGKKYIDLGKCFNTKLKAEPGEILTMGVEEIIPQEKKLQWLGARVLDIDKDRKEPYFAKQAMDIAQRANVLQKAEEGGIDYKVGDKGKGVLQLHIMGIEEDDIPALKKASQEAARSRHSPLRLKLLLKRAIGEQGCHIDVRLVKEGADYFEGGEIMIGNFKGLDKIKKLDQGGKLRFGWKVSRAEEPEAETIRGPVDWMDAGKGRIEIFPPGEAGATANQYGAMILLDSFDWEAMEPQDKHAKKFEFKGTKFIPEGTYLFAYVPVTAAGKRGERVWMISKLKEEEEEKKNFLMAKPEETENTIRIPGDGGRCDVTATITISAEKGVKAVYCGLVKKVRTYVFDKAKGWTMATAKTWVKDRGKKAVAKIGENAMFKILKIDKKKQIVGGVVYEPDEVDTQGDYTDNAEIGKAMFRFMEKYATNTKRIRINHKGRKFFFPILECFQPEHDTIKGDERLKAGSWWMMIKVTNKSIWKDIEEGKLTGFSMGGRAKA